MAHHALKEMGFSMSVAADPPIGIA